MQTAMQDLREDLADSIVLINNRLDFLDNITDENLRNLCKVMVDTTLKGIIKRIDDELLEMEKQQIIDAYYGYELYLDREFRFQQGGQAKILTFDQWYETYGSKGSDETKTDKL